MILDFYRLKDLFTRNVFYHVSVILFILIMGPSSILSVIHTATIGTMLNNNYGNNGHWLKNVTCIHTLKRRCCIHLENAVRSVTLPLQAFCCFTIIQ